MNQCWPSQSLESEVCWLKALEGQSALAQSVGESQSRISKNVGPKALESQSLESEVRWPKALESQSPQSQVRWPKAFASQSPESQS